MVRLEDHSILPTEAGKTSVVRDDLIAMSDTSRRVELMGGVPNLRINSISRTIVRRERSRDNISRQVILHTCLLPSKKCRHDFDGSFGGQYLENVSKVTSGK